MPRLSAISIATASIYSFNTSQGQPRPLCPQKRYVKEYEPKGRLRTPATLLSASSAQGLAGDGRERRGGQYARVASQVATEASAPARRTNTTLQSIEESECGV